MLHDNTIAWSTFVEFFDFRSTVLKLARLQQRPWKFQKIWWYGIMKEFDCKVPSTWSVSGKVRVEAFTYRHLEKDRKEELSQLDYILGPMR